jgi:hypothetical protein
MPKARPLLATILSIPLAACVAPLPAGVRVHPQGLLPSQDTVTTPRNHLELEAIGVWADAERTTTAAIRYGLSERTEVYILQDLHRTISDPAGPDPSGIGDGWLGLRHRLIDADASGVAHAFAAEVRLPHGDPDQGLGTGQLELRLLHLRDGTWGGYGWTTNADLRLIGDAGGRPDPAIGGSLTLTTPLLRVAGRTLPLGFLAEAGGLWHPEEDLSPTWFALGLRLPIHPSLEIQIAWMDDRWVANIGRLLGDTLDLRTP